MALRDVFFRVLKAPPEGIQETIDLAGAGDLRISHHSTHGTSVFREDMMGLDFFTICYVEKSLSCLSNEQGETSDLLSGSIFRLNRYTGALSVYKGLIPIIARPTVSVLSTTKSFWTFFLRFLGQSGK